MTSQGRRPIAGMERTPSGAISRSKTSLAKRADKRRQASTESAKREARVGMALKEKTQLARGRVYGLTPTQAASHHASTVEGRLHLKGVITATELLAVEHYLTVVAKFSRAMGMPVAPSNMLARYQPSEPRAVAAPPSGASVVIARDRFVKADEALKRAGLAAAWAVARVCRDREELPHSLRPAFLAGVQALVAHFRLSPDPDRTAKVA